jgi:hypothetical protein
MNSRVNRILLLSLCFLLLGAAAARADDYKVETFEAPPPEEFAAPVRAALGNQALRVMGPDGVLCEIWLRKSVPAKPGAAAPFGIVYGQLAEGTLVAGIRVPESMSDYRRQRIPAGVYTLRYGLHPVDGNHMGVAPHRDFLLLVRAPSDGGLAALPSKTLFELSGKAAGTNHPTVLSLAEPGEPPEELPAVEHDEIEDHWLLYFEITLEDAQGGAAGKATLALVVVGHAAEA